MTPELARFIVHTRKTFARLNFQQLYQLALSLAAELHDRDVDAEPEAYALCAALLAHANGEQRKIFSEDCSDDFPRRQELRRGYQAIYDAADRPAEKS